MSPAPFQGQGRVPIDLRGIINGQYAEMVGDRIIPRHFFGSVKINSTTAASRLARVMVADASGGSFDINLPDAILYKDEWFAVVKEDNTANTVTVSPEPGDLIAGLSSVVIDGFEESIFFFSDGDNWHLLGSGDVTGGGGSTSTSLVVSPSPFTCPALASVRDLVYQTGDDTVELAQANAESTMYAIGFIVDKPTTTTCNVAYYGELDGFSGLTFRKKYFVSPTVAGALTDTEPTDDGHIVQVVAFARNTTTLVLVQDPFLTEV